MYFTQYNTDDKPYQNDVKITICFSIIAIQIVTSTIFTVITVPIDVIIGDLFFKNRRQHFFYKMNKLYTFQQNYAIFYKINKFSIKIMNFRHKYRKTFYLRFLIAI